MHKSLRSVRCSATEHRDALVNWLQFIIENLTRLAHCSRLEATFLANASIPLSVSPLHPPDLQSREACAICRYSGKCLICEPDGGAGRVEEFEVSGLAQC